MSAPYAPAAIRDQFLSALDAGDHRLSAQLAKDLTECSNPLPSVLCEKLQLPERSTYGAAAQRILTLYPVQR